MTDQEPPKKDLTGILELSRSQSAEIATDSTSESGNDSFLPAQASIPETIDSFESIEELSKSAGSSSDFASQASASIEPMPEMPSPPSIESEMAPVFVQDTGPVIEAPEQAVSPDVSPDISPDISSAPELEVASPQDIQAEAPASESYIEKEPTLVPANPTFVPSHALSQVKNFSENAAIAKASAQVALPFSLRINGELETYEREKLLDVLSSHGTGISPVDLEPQFEGKKILIPRISEYTLVCIVQALRGTAAQMRFGTSDSIYASDDTKEEAPQVSEFEYGSGATYAEEDSDGNRKTSPAESIPITLSSALPEIPKPFVVDTVTASAALQSEAVEAKSSSEYQEVLENLQKEIKYKAFRKGATGITHFTVQLTQLTMPSHYRLTVMGTAIRARTQTDPPALPKGRIPSA